MDPFGKEKKASTEEPDSNPLLVNTVQEEPCFETLSD